MPSVGLGLQDSQYLITDIVNIMNTLNEILRNCKQILDSTPPGVSHFVQKIKLANWSIRHSSWIGQLSLTKSRNQSGKPGYITEMSWSCKIAYNSDFLNISFRI